MRLSPFADNLKVVIRHPPDREPQKMARQLAYVIRLAKWQLLPSSAAPIDEQMKDFDEIFSEGITVGTNDASAGEKPEVVDLAENASVAAEALAEELNNNGIDAKKIPVSTKWPYGLIVVRVGPKLSKDRRKTLEESKDEEMERWTKELRAERRKRWEEKHSTKPK
jgi:hypothetical protein